MKFHSLLFTCVLFCSMTSCQNKMVKSGQNDSIYTYQTPSRGGIGKVYMDREIAHVMGHLGASWLERVERNEEENTELAIANLSIKPSDVIADIGAGTGYYAFRMAKEAKMGHVFAVDIQPEMLAIMKEKINAQNINNVTLTLGTESSPNLPADTLDLAIMVDVYHELSHPREMMEQLIRALKPGGQFILLEYRMEDTTVPIKRLHKMTEAQAIKEMEAVGLSFKENITNLPWQHFLVFIKPGK